MWTAKQFIIFAMNGDGLGPAKRCDSLRVTFARVIIQMQRAIDRLTLLWLLT
jgi:hypothetical protein